MRVAVKANLTPACGGFKPPPKGLSPTNRSRSLDLVPPRQGASVVRRSARVGHALGRPKPLIGLRRRAGATPIGARELSPRLGAAQFISRKLSATPPMRVRGESPI